MKILLKIIWKWLVRPLIGLVIIILSTWAVLAIYLAKSPGQIFRFSAAGIFVFANLTVFLNAKRRWRFLAFFAGTFVIVLVWWSLIPPSNNRDWDTKVSVLPRAILSNNFVTVYNIRNFDYRTDNEFTPHYYDKTFDINKLEKLYLAVSYWGNLKKIAHTMLSFEFEGGDCLAISIEVRREKGEKYDTLRGFFKMFEIIYVIADERDVIRLRTNYTGEQVYLYPLKIPLKECRDLLLDILAKANELNSDPEFYNTITRNCTISLIKHFANVSKNKIEFYIEYLLNGLLDWRLYQYGVIDTELPPEETKHAYFISEIAQKYDKDPDFSKKIRSNFPESSSEEPSPSLNNIKPDKAEEKGNPESLNVKWNSDSTSLDFSLSGKKVSYPQDMKEGKFPSAKAPPEFKFEKKWPVVTMNAKWSISTKNWPSKYKPYALNLILMLACDAEAYEHVFPNTVSASGFTSPPEFAKEAEDPLHYNLAELARGKQLNYEITAKAGLGARDYKIITKIFVGLSEDGKMVFYHDKPEHISRHLKVREFIFAAHDTGDVINFEANLFCVCAPSKLLRGEKMKRVENDGKYFVQQMYDTLSKKHTVESINLYLEKVKQRN